VKQCREKGLGVTAVGGPCAALLALTLSGFDPLPFQFVGFLPKKQSELSQSLSHIFLYQGTSIAYETSHRILKTLAFIESLAPDRTLCIARELTKLHEECLKGLARELLNHFMQHPPKGEMVLLVERSYQEKNWDHLSLQEHVEWVQNQWKLSLNEAIKEVAKMRELPKRMVYQEMHGTNSSR
jgi:16S rRNA (cytidine1402-2'-O)-methyltransferase